MHNWTKSFLALFLGALTLASCSRKDQEPRPDVSSIQVPLRIRHFEKDLFALDTANIGLGLKRLEEDYGEFAELFFTRILPAKDSVLVPEGPERFIKDFLSNPDIQSLYDTCMLIYGDFSGLDREFEQAFRYLNYYFPKLPTPDVTTYISGYSVGNFIYREQSLGVGLDFFLGADYPYQRYSPQNPNFSQYLTRTFTREHLVLKTLIPLVEDLAGDPTGIKLLDAMIHTGKQIYVLDKLLPDVPDSILIELPAAQTQWLQDNERDIWAFFLSEDLLYSDDWQKIRKYVEYSPSSPGMPTEAPGRTGTWMGWQIVRSYMKNQPETSLSDLLAQKDSQKFLQMSRYKPPRK